MRELDSSRHDLWIVGFLAFAMQHTIRSKRLQMALVVLVCLANYTVGPRITFLVAPAR